MDYTASPIGNEISCVMHGIGKTILNNNEFLKSTLLEALKKEKFTVLNTICHGFKPQGFSILALLAESHASIHTYPEHGSLVFHIYSCRSPEDGLITLNHIKKQLNPKKVDTQRRNIIVKIEK